MATPVTYRPVEKRYLGNSNKKEVHDLHNEQPQCQIHEIIWDDHAVVFSPDTLNQAHSEGYDNGHYCIGARRGRSFKGVQKIDLDRSEASNLA